MLTNVVRTGLVVLTLVCGVALGIAPAANAATPTSSTATTAMMATGSAQPATTTGATTAARPTMSPFTIVKMIDKASP